jgi:hypothetical protein
MARASAGIAVMLDGATTVNADELLQNLGTSTSETLPARAFRGEHQPRPLTFDPSKLKGLSETHSFTLGEQLRRRRSL